MAERALHFRDRCARRGCDQPSRWLPYLKFYPRIDYQPAEPVELFLGTPTCDMHKKGSTVDNFLTDDIRLLAVKLCAVEGRVSPNFKRTRLVWTEIDGPKAQEYLGHLQRRQQR